MPANCLPPLLVKSISTLGRLFWSKPGVDLEMALPVMAGGSV